MAFLKYILGNQDTVEGRANRFDERYLYFFSCISGNNEIKLKCICHEINCLEEQKTIRRMIFLTIAVRDGNRSLQTLIPLDFSYSRTNLTDIRSV